MINAFDALQLSHYNSEWTQYVTMIEDKIIEASHAGHCETLVEIKYNTVMAETLWDYLKSKGYTIRTVSTKVINDQCYEKWQIKWYHPYISKGSANYEPSY